jgi:hypothetical protein
VLAALVYVAIGFSTREFALFNSDGETARTLLLALAGAQGTWAILALTLTLVGVQIVASSYSPALTGVTRISPVLAASLTLLVASAAFDVILVARSGDWIDGHAVRGATMIDLAIFSAALLLATATFTSFASLSQVSPEHVARRVLQRFDSRWLGRLPEQWPMRHHHPVAGTGDPGRDLATVLRALVERNDPASVRLILYELGEHLLVLGAGAHWPAVDAYLHASLGSVVRLTARQLDDSALDDWLIVLIRPLITSAGWGDPPVVDYLGFGEAPDGDRLLFETADSAVRFNRTAAARSALHLIESRACSVLPHLPKDDETVLFNPNLGTIQDPSEADRQLRSRRDRISRIVSEGYLPFLEELGKAAIGSEQRAVLGTATYVICGVVSAAVSQGRDSPRQRRATVGWGLARLHTLVECATEAGLADAVHLSLYYALEDLDASDSDDAALIDLVAHQVQEITVDSARAGTLGYGHILELAMVPVIGARGSPTAARVAVDGLIEALAILESSAAPAQQRYKGDFVEELRSRIDQVAHSSAADPATRERARDAISASRGRASASPGEGDSQ